MNVPCGCAERKEVMFDHGQPDIVLAALVGIPLALVLFLLLKGKAS